MVSAEDELKGFAGRIEGAARDLGFYAEDLTIYILTERQMLAPVALSGAPRRYAHWSFGKKAESFNRLMAQKGVAISSLDAFLLYDLPHVPILGSAPLYRQVSAIARAYVQVDFIRQNTLWKSRNFDNIRHGMEEHAAFVKGLIENPEIGIDKVEAILNAAHWVAYQCPHTKALEGRVSDLALEIAQNSPKLAEWQREIFRIVHKEWFWFLPFIETLFMIKGWTSFWQPRLLKAANLPEELYWRCFLDFTSEIRVPELGLANPSSVGYRIFEETMAKSSREDTALFRENARKMIGEGTDASFIAGYLTEGSAQEAGLLSYGPRSRGGEDAKILEVKDISADSGWERVRDELVSWVAGNAFPLIRVTQNTEDTLKLEHQFEGRELKNDANTQGVLSGLRDALKRNVVLVHSSLDQNGKEVKTETTLSAKGGSTSRSLSHQNYSNGCD